MLIFHHIKALNLQLIMLNVFFLATPPIKNVFYAMILISIGFEFQ